MKKAIVLLIGVTFAIVFVWAQQGPPPGRGMQHGGMHGKGPQGLGAQGMGAGGMMHGPLQLMAPLKTEFASETNPLTREKIDLGRMLYYDPRLSKGHTVSCNSCHRLDKFGVDSLPVSPGHLGQLGARNSPTVYNAAGHFVQFWDGRAADVEEQAKGPVLNPVEMAMPSEAAVVEVLNSMPGYVAAFKKAFPRDADPVTYDNMARAIGAFERKLVTPSRWDRFLNGDREALTAEERTGFMNFHHSGCDSCHNGALVGGGFYEKLGEKKAWLDTADLGRYEVTRADKDKMVFKVPSLRNVEKTGPYFHNGQVKTLPEAVRLMGEYQLGLALSDTEVNSIVAFLKSMTGEVPADYVKAPKLPASTARTPKPQR